MVSKPENWLRRAKAIVKGRRNPKSAAKQDMADGTTQGPLGPAEYSAETNAHDDTPLSQQEETRGSIGSSKLNSHTLNEDDPSRQGPGDEQAVGQTNQVIDTLDDDEHPEEPTPYVPPVVLEAHTGPVIHVDISRDGKLIASVSTDRTLCIWDSVSRKLLRSFTLDCTRVVAVAISPCARNVAVAMDRSIKIWDLNVVTTSSSNSKPQKTHKLFEPVNSVAFSPDGSLLACGAEDQIYVWHLPSHTIHTSAEVKGHAHNLFFSATDGLGYTSNAGQIIFRDKDHLILNWQRMDHGEKVDCVGISPHDEWTATGSATGRVRVWGPAPRSWKPSRTYELGPAAVVSLALHPRSGTLVAASSVGIWELGLSDNHKRLSWAVEGISSVASSPVCSCIVSGADDGNVRIHSTVRPEGVTDTTQKCLHGNFTTFSSPPEMQPLTNLPLSPSLPAGVPPTTSAAPSTLLHPPQPAQQSASPTPPCPATATSVPTSPKFTLSAKPASTARALHDDVALPASRPTATKSSSASVVLARPGSSATASRKTSIDPFQSASADGVYHPAPEADFNPTMISTTKSYSHYFGPPAAYKEPRKCYMCLGYVEYVAGSSEMCRCR